MRPVLLEMQGFSTFRERTVVDFADVDLLALVGPTGAGKSSVIDAITFALYGSAARYDEKAVAPVVNQLSNEARVRFEFEVAGVAYVATRVVRRTAKGATTKEARFECGDTVLAGDAKSVTEATAALLGLDFVRFNKTVVLPQGRFAEFLHDRPADRQELLRELFGFGVYERVGRRARERAARLQLEAEVAERGLAGVDVSAERKAALADAAAVLTATRTLVSERAEVLAGHEAQLVEHRGRLQQLDVHLHLLRGVAMPAGVAELGDTLSAAETAAEAATADREAARVALRTAIDAVAAGPSPSECRSLLQRYEQHRELELAVADRSAALVSARATYAAAAAAADAARGAVAAARSAADAARHERDRAEAAVADAGDRSRSWRSIVDAHARLIDDERELGQRRGDTARAAAAADTASTERDTARRVLDQLELQAPAAVLATHLHVGEPCPVCAQTVRELPPITRVETHQLQAARSAVEAADATASIAVNAHLAAAATVEVLAARVADRRRALDAGPGLAEATGGLARVAELEAAAAAARTALSLAEAAVRIDGLDQVLRVEHEAMGALSAAETLCRSAEADLSASAEMLAGGRAEHDVAADLRLAERLESDRATAAATEEAADRRAAAAAAALQHLRTTEADARAPDQAARDAVAALQPPPGSTSLINDWARLIDWCTATATRLGDERDDVMAAGLALASRRDDVQAEVRRSVVGLVGRPDAPIDQVRDQLVAAEATALADLEQFERERLRVAAQQHQVSQLRAEADVARALGELLKTSNFQQWLLEEAMDDLVARATVRLHELTSGQYSLVADAGAFRIVDHRNADEVRDARSLSGGETFLTSLALALALADSSADLAAEGAAPMESIFLDEGFGTLDPDTLDVVAGTIEELGATGRMVGIVTHIRELAERMPTRFEVAKGPAGSTVTRVDQ